MNQFLILFPPFKDKPSTVVDVTELTQQFLADRARPTIVPVHRLPYRRIYPTDAVQDHRRRGYFRFKGVWYTYRVCRSPQSSVGEWSLTGTVSRKLPPHVIELYIEHSGCQLNELLLDVDPITRDAAKKYYNRIYKKQYAGILSDK